MKSSMVINQIRPLLLSLLPVLIVLTSCKEESSYRTDWGVDEIDFAFDGKADGLLDAAPTIELSQTMTGYVDERQIDVYAIDLRAQDRIRIIMTVLDGTLNPHIMLYYGVSTYIHSESYEIHGGTLTKTYEVESSGRYYIVTRAYRNQGSGNYSIRVECLGGPCSDDYPAGYLTTNQTNDCIRLTRECAFDRMGRYSGNVGPARSRTLVDECVNEMVLEEEGLSCAEACSAQDQANAFCERIIGMLPFYADQAPQCLDELSDCMSVCYRIGGNDPLSLSENWEDFGRQPELMCLLDGYNGDCDEYARTHALCGGDIHDNTMEQCLALCKATSGAWLDSLGATCEEMCIIYNPDAWQFFAFGDTRTNTDILEEIIRSMFALDPEAVACFNGGDITANGTLEEWNDHHQRLADGAPDNSVPPDPLGIVRQSHFRTDVSEWGPYTRYIGVFGNHDDGSADWLTRWNNFLIGQSELGHNSEDGIYFTLTYNNAFFVVLDSVHPSIVQTDWLQRVLQSPEALASTWKFVFFHHPVYPCNDKSPFHEGLEWVEFIESYQVDIAFVSHSHTYERTCPMIGGTCASGGVIYLNSSNGGAPARSVRETKTETVSHEGRNDTYDCSEILDSARGYWDNFCHITIDGCILNLNCYGHDYNETQDPPYDTMVLNKCG